MVDVKDKQEEGPALGMASVCDCGSIPDFPDSDQPTSGRITLGGSASGRAESQLLRLGQSLYHDLCFSTSTPSHILHTRGRLFCVILAVNTHYDNCRCNGALVDHADCGTHTK